MECRFCFEGGQLISPCKCSGSQKWIHETCLKKWYNMKSENSVCSVCKYRFKVLPSRCIEFVPPDIHIYIRDSVYQGLLGFIVNGCMYILIAIHILHNGAYYNHAAYQLVYLLCYYLVLYFRYYSIVQNKQLYLSLLDDDAKKLLLIQLVAICGLPFVHNRIYHCSAVFLTTYTHQPVLFLHYKTLIMVNNCIEYHFISPVPSEEPTSSS